MAEILCEIAGIVAEVRVRPGQRVEPDTDLLILESMKMQIPVKAGRAGVVREVRVQEGQFVNMGDVLAVVDDA